MSRVARMGLVLLLVLALAACKARGHGGNGGDGNGDGGGGPSLIAATPDTGASWTFPPPRFTPVPVATSGPYDTPGPTAPDLTLFLTSTASIANTGDDPVGVTVWIRDTTKHTWVQVLAQTLVTGDAIDQDLPPATYSVAFTWNGRPQETCNLAVTDGNTIDFNVLSRHVVVTKSDVTPRTGADLDVATSPICQAPVS